jgi:hypothetical protein
MRNIMVAFGISVAALAAAAPASAATFYIDLTGPSDSEFFGNKSNSAGDILDSFWFDVPAGIASGFVGSIALAPALDVTLTSVKFDGNLLSKLSTGTQELWTFGDTPISAGKHTLEVAGTWGSRGGSYAGTINYSAVPEPAAWGMLIAGFGAIGATMRRRRKLTVSYS